MSRRSPQRWRTLLLRTTPKLPPECTNLMWTDLARLPLYRVIGTLPFIPPVAQRELRDLTRYRSTFIRERTTLVNRVQKLLEDANIKLAAVASDIMGVSGRAMLAALLAGHADPQALADLAKGRLRSKRDQLAKALDGRVKPHHRFVLTEL